MLLLILFLALVAATPHDPASEIQGRDRDESRRHAPFSVGSQESSATIHDGTLRRRFAGIVLAEGDSIPSVPGATVATLQSPFVDGSGRVAFTGTLHAANGGEHFLWSGDSLRWRNGLALPVVLEGAESSFGIDTEGDFLYSPLVEGMDAVWSEDGPLLVAGDPAPLVPGAVNTFNSRPSMDAWGVAYWVSGYDNDGDGVTDGRVLYRESADGTLGALLQTGQVVAGFAIAAPSGIGFDYDISDSGQHQIHELVLETGSVLNDQIIAVDGVAVARESEATGSGDSWDNFGEVCVENRGNHLFTGDTDAAIDQDDFVAYNGQIVVREGDVVDGAPLTSPARPLAIGLNNRGSALHAWKVLDGSERLFFVADTRFFRETSFEILRTGDVLDVDQDGNADAIVTDLNLGASTSPALPLTDDGVLYLEADLDFLDGLGNREAILAFDQSFRLTVKETAQPGTFLRLRSGGGTPQQQSLLFLMAVDQQLVRAPLFAGPLDERGAQDVLGMLPPRKEFAGLSFTFQSFSLDPFNKIRASNQATVLLTDPPPGIELPPVAPR